ncbi:SDR family oxidoreductase [Microbulbifer sp. ANSA003]|uniref:SDR family oxidoreductase n=1 Tax=Microbulbifer sp. ANSA003 TaxID=3243360 RepID=UPI0040422BFE
MTVLIFGGSGNVGRALIPILYASGAKIRVATRSTAYAASLPDDIDTVIADMDDPSTLRSAFKGVESVFLLIANGPKETHQGLSTLAIAAESPPRHIVYLSSDLAVRAPMIPHAGGKFAIETALRASGIAHTILRPTYFAQNDLVQKDVITAGAYATPLGPHPVARIDIRDVALAAASALLDIRAKNEVFLLSSLDAPNGNETAALWSIALGHAVIYPDLTPEEFANSIETMVPPWLNFDLLVMHRWFKTNGHPIHQEDLEAQAALLPQGPRSYRSFVEETAHTWQSETQNHQVP